MIFFVAWVKSYIQELLFKRRSFLKMTKLFIQKLVIFILTLFVFSSLAMAQVVKKKGKVTNSDAESSSKPTITYDLSGSVGSQNGNSYTEINLGLNWALTDWLTWRNAAFSRFGTNVDSVSGLDSSARFSFLFGERGASVELFGGPGVRVASRDNNAAFAEGGLTLNLGGLHIGGGAKYLSYFSTRKDTSGVSLPKDETQYFIVLSGGGAF